MFKFNLLLLEKIEKHLTKNIISDWFTALFYGSVHLEDEN